MPANPLPDLPFFFGEINENQGSLNPEESHHLARVMRKNVGDKILFSDGLGKLALAEIKELSKKNTLLEILEFYDNGVGDNKPKLTLALSLLKNNDRFEFFLEKCTELGIDGIQPYTANHTERVKYNAERYQKIVISACKQSRRASLPILHNCLDFNQTINKYAPILDEKWISHCHWKKENHYIGEIDIPNRDSIILIGPEGDFDEKEIEFALENGFKSLNFGRNRFRSETAAIFACALWQEKAGKLL